MFSHNCNQFFHQKHLNFSIYVPCFLPSLNCQKSCQGRGFSLYLPLGSDPIPAASYAWFGFSTFLLIIHQKPRKGWRKRCQDSRKDLIRAYCAVVWEHFLWRERGAERDTILCQAEKVMQVQGTQSALAKSQHI